MEGLVWQYSSMGWLHAMPWGYDHILFILSLFLRNSNYKSLGIQCLFFTIAHSISMGLAAFFTISNSTIIEPLIVLSIVAVSIENIISLKPHPFDFGIIFFFGLVHGLGFANALQTIGLPKEHFFAALFSFNIGLNWHKLASFFLPSFWFINGKKGYLPC
ncbi:HupE/UreJ family protein [Flavobacterium aciduliphilum]|uniref:HupE/UreJ protein n=1 Tax=Flavobacterium aciduliphilum TaxID=1101402 RepID=A0A328YZK7_9FLAO|nr:HupE/UreJ family protein [Flavobacterium aciduliphilum]RAR75506.1 HupE/UreJ protein [Flavobacterium aciduliphilum]